VPVKNIRPKECDGRFNGARQNQQCKEKLPEETMTALKSGRTLTHKIVCPRNIKIL
jgi:hypothetical protein